jgi:hypothetical protein
LEDGSIIKTDNKYQRWQNHSIRLYKMTKSLEIFRDCPGINGLFENCIEFGMILLENKYDLTYGKKNFNKYFR